MTAAGVVELCFPDRFPHSGVLDKFHGGCCDVLECRFPEIFAHSGAFNTFPEGICGVLKLCFPNNLSQDGDCNKFLWGLCSVVEFAVAYSWTLDSEGGTAQGQASICGGSLLDATLRSWPHVYCDQDY